MDLVEVKSHQELRQAHKEWIEEKLKNGDPFREDQWTESLAVGGEEFVKEIRDKLGFRAIGRKVTKDGEQQQLREAQRPYLGRFGSISSQSKNR